MSFFYDLISELGLNEVKVKPHASIIFDEGMSFCGNFKIENISGNEVCLRDNKTKYMFFGEKLNIKTIAKGEIVIKGIITKIEVQGESHG